MNSRSILVAAGFCLACTILLGSALLQFAVGGSRAPADEMATAPSERAQQPRADTSEAGTGDIEPGQAAARRLETLLQRTETLIDARSGSAESYEQSPSGAAPLSDEAISFFGEMVRIIDETKGYSFLVVVGDPNLETASRRAEVLRSSLQLALRHPSRLQIEDRSTSRPQVTVRAIETGTTP